MMLPHHAQAADARTQLMTVKLVALAAVATDLPAPAAEVLASEVKAMVGDKSAQDVLAELLAQVKGTYPMRRNYSSLLRRQHNACTAVLPLHVGLSVRSKPCIYLPGSSQGGCATIKNL